MATQQSTPGSPGMHTGKRFPRIAAIIGLSLLICLLYVGSDLVSAFGDHKLAADETPTTLQGRVVDESGTPLPDLQVTLYQKRGWWRWTGETTTDAQGDYAFADLAPGAYRVYVWDPSLEHLPRFYKNEPDFASATELTITSGQEPDPLDDIVLARVQGPAQMGILAHMSDITGYVHAPDGTPIPDVHVTAYRLNDWGGWSTVRAAVTDDEGAYGFYGLETGIYRIYFNDSSRTYLDEYYNNAEHLNDATEIAVQGENMSGLNVVLDKPGTIVGTLSSTDGSDPGYSDVQVYHEEDGVWQRAAWAYPGPESDMYRISGLRPGTYRVGAETPTDPNSGTTGNVDYAPEYYDNAIYIEDGADVQVTGNMTTTGIDFTLTPGGTITGFVTNVDDAPVSGVAVKAYRKDGEVWRLASVDYTTYVAYPGPDTDVQPYTLAGLWDGTYRVKFEAPAGYLNEYYDDAADINAADDITVSLGETVPNVSAVLTADGAVISGQAASDTGEPLSGIRVSAYKWDEDGSYWPYSSYRNTLTDDTGNYHLRGLATGVYRVAFEDPTKLHQGVYYDGVINENAATPITITSPVSNVVGVSGTLTGCAYISGTVTSGTSGGTSLSGIRVWAYREGSDWSSYRSATTDSDGAYLLTDLVSDTYRIGFEDPYGTYGFEYYDGQQTVGAADDIVLTTGAPVTGVDAGLSPGGRITGTLSTADGQDVGRVDITAYLNNGSAWEEATSYSGYPGPNSTYDLGGLVSGTYRLKFEEDRHKPQYYDGQATITDATPIGVNVGATTQNIDVTFEPYAGVISGTVTNKIGNPLSDMTVKAYVYDSWWWSTHSQTTTDAEGHYGLTSLKPGEYRVSFHDPNDVYFSEYYADAEDLSGATTIVITDTAPITTGVDAQLTAKSAITGVVTFPEGTPNRLDVWAYADDGGVWTKQASTSFAYPGPSVTFALDDLRTDTYKVGFEATGFKPAFYDGVETLTNATGIPLSVGATVPNINATLDDEYGKITGVVTTDSPWPSDVTVSAYRDEGSGWESFKEITLHEDPEAGPALAYELIGLPTGTYRVCFSAPGYADWCYDGKSQVDNATDITVTNGETTPNIDADLVSEVAYSAVSGWVKATDAQPIQGIRVDFYRRDTWGNWYRYAFDDTDSSGDYSVDGLREGAYRLHFYDPDGYYAETYYWGSTALTTADTIALSNGSDNTLSEVLLNGDGNVPANVSLAVNPGTIPANGTATAHLTATVTNGADNPVPDGTPVRFETDLGSVGSQVITTTTEDGEGRATATLTSGTTAGIANVSATSGDVSTSTTVTLTPNAPDTLVLEAAADTLPADGTSSTTLTARVTDAYGNRVADGTDVAFTTTSGDFDGQDTVTKQTVDGEATVELTAATSAGTATITASSDGASSDSITIDFDANIVITANPTAIVADGQSQATLTVAVSDDHDNPVVDGTPVTLTTTLGDFGGQSTVTKQTVNGEVTADLTSSTDIGQATVTATSGGRSDSITIDFFQGEETTVDPDQGGELDYTDPEDNTETTVEVPGGAVADDGTTLRYTSESTSPPAPDLNLAGEPFQLDLYKDGEKVEGAFDKAITVTITYDPATLEGVDTASLKLYRWHDDDWKAVTPENFWPSEGKEESCTFDDGTSTLTCYLWKLSEFAPMGEPITKVYLPLVIRR